MLLRTFFLATALIFASHGLAAPAEPRIQSVVETVMVERAIPGAQLVLISPEEPWQRSFGVRDLAAAAPMTDDTLVQAGSVTKIFTASLVADLVAQGKLRWTDDLSKLLPGVAIRPDLATITLDELVTHSARLPGNPPNRVDKDGVMQPYSVTELYASLADPASKRDGPGRRYSNWGYAILGHIVERTAGKPFEAVLRERIFAPLAMTNSKIALGAPDEQRLATHYWPEDSPRIARPRWVFGEVAGFGGITSTAVDLAKFLAYQMAPERRPDVLDAAEVRALREIRVLTPSWTVAGGRGWLVVRDPTGEITIEHSGEVDGHSSYMGFSAETGVGIAVTANLGGSSARQIALPVLAHAVARARAERSLDRAAALALVRKRQWADAEAALAKLVAAAPDDGELWHQLGAARYELRDLPGAEAALSSAERSSPKPASSTFLLALIAASRGQTDAAFARLDRAMRASVGDVDLERAEFRALHADSRWAKLGSDHLALRRHH